MEKRGKKITTLKWTKYQKPKTKIWDEQSKSIIIPREALKSFVYILQGKMGKTENKRKKITKSPKYQKPKDENMGWTDKPRSNLWMSLKESLDLSSLP